MIFSPATAYLAGNAVLCASMPDFRIASTTWVSVPVTGGPAGGWPVAVAELVMNRLATSASVVM